MCAHRVSPTDSLTWDDVCQLWDNGFYTVEDVKSIATLYFDSTEWLAVLDVIENVEIDSQTLAAINTDIGSDMQPAAMDIFVRAFESIEFEIAHNLLEPDRTNPWRGLRRGLH
jgi:hypothetical protein